MDHSVQGYLKRRSTEELVLALQYYYMQNDPENYEQVIAFIEQELRRREEVTESSG